MPEFSEPTPEQYQDAVVDFYFGITGGYVERCVWRAYRDLCRTLHGVKDYPGAYSEAAELLAGCMLSLPESRAADFDGFHRELALQLCQLYRSHRYERFTIGHSQKWINMTLKYIYVLGENRVPRFRHLYSVAHAPIDGIMIERLRHYGAPELKTVWSKLSNYDEYMSYQEWIRKRFPDSAPLAVEFHLYTS